MAPTEDNPSYMWHRLYVRRPGGGSVIVLFVTQSVADLTVGQWRSGRRGPCHRRPRRPQCHSVICLRRIERVPHKMPDMRSNPVASSRLFTVSVSRWKRIKKTKYQNALKLTYSNLEFQNFSRGTTPGPPASRGREGRERKGRERKRREGRPSWSVADEALSLKSAPAYCHSLNRITDERGNGRQPNFAGMRKEWPSGSNKIKQKKLVTCKKRSFVRKEDAVCLSFHVRIILTLSLFTITVIFTVITLLGIDCNFFYIYVYIKIYIYIIYWHWNAAFWQRVDCRSSPFNCILGLYSRFAIKPLMGILECCIKQLIAKSQSIFDIDNRAMASLMVFWAHCFKLVCALCAVIFCERSAHCIFKCLLVNLNVTSVSETIRKPPLVKAQTAF